MRPRILLIADVAGWAFDNIAHNIRDNLGDTNEISICYMEDCAGRPENLLIRHFLPGEYDHIHFFWRDDLRALLHPGHIHLAAASSGASVDAVIDALCTPTITTSIYDHLHLTPEALAQRAGALHFAHGYTVSSPILEKIYREAPGLPLPDAMIPDGVRTDFFTPGDGAPEGVAGSNGPLIVGWVGNSRWGEHSHQDAKGLRTILQPALAMLQAEGVNITGHFADIQDRRRNREEMQTYYREIDVLVCASLIEGTPNPVLEAMASGAAIISTDVGIVRKALGPAQSALILTERSPQAMATALRKLADDRALLARLRTENRARIADWDWSRTIAGWPGFWSAARARRDDPRLARFRRLVLADACRRIAPAFSAQGQPIPTLHLNWRARLHSRAVDWLYARPRLARTVNRLRGRTP